MLKHLLGSPQVGCVSSLKQLVFIQKLILFSYSLVGSLGLFSAHCLHRKVSHLLGTAFNASAMRITESMYHCQDNLREL